MQDEFEMNLSDSARSLRFSQMKLTNDDDVKTMFFVFGQHSTRGPIELDASLVRSAEQFWKVCIGLGTTKRSGLCWRDQRKKLV